jgi:hypothetical protein
VPNSVPDAEVGDGITSAAPFDYVFTTSNGTPLGHRNVESRALQRAAAAAGIAPAPRFHDLRHTFASHLIVDLRLDVAQVSRILGHASVTTTLNIWPGSTWRAVVAKHRGQLPRGIYHERRELAPLGGPVADGWQRHRQAGDHVMVVVEDGCGDADRSASFSPLVRSYPRERICRSVST